MSDGMRQPTQKSLDGMGRGYPLYLGDGALPGARVRCGNGAAGPKSCLTFHLTVSAKEASLSGWRFFSGHG
jgi:hypothetical protein